MSLAGRIVKHYTIMDAKTTTGIGNTIDVGDFRNCVISISTASSAALTVKAQGAIGKNTNSITTDLLAPDFSAAQSVSNQWSNIQMVDLNDGSPVTGTTGVVLTGTDICKLYEVNINGLDFLNFDVTAISAGAITITIQLSSNI